MKQATRKPVISKTGIVAIAFVYLGLLAGLWIFQERLLYSPVDQSVGNWEFIDDNQWVSEVSFSSTDGTKLIGWYAQCENAKGSVLFFHGASENVATQCGELTVLCQQLNLNVFLFDYRGFGKSEGKPSENGFIEDGKAAMRKLNELSNTNPGDVIVMARSLGGGAATRVAIDLGAKGLVLQSTYAALDDLCASKLWYMPVRPLLRTKFRTIDWIAEYKGPCLFAHGTEDKLIPFENGKRLFAASGSNRKRFYAQESAGHHDALTRDYFKELDQFIRSLDEITL